MDRSTAKSLIEALESFLGPFEDEHDVKVIVGTGSFGSSSLTVKLELAELSESGEALSRMANEFKSLAVSYGLRPDDLGKEFIKNGNKYKIVGLKPRSHKYPVLAECNGKQFKFTAATVCSYLRSGKRSKEDILNDLRSVESSLSPENLTMDGEASATWIRMQTAELNRKKQELLVELGSLK